MARSALDPSLRAPTTAVADVEVVHVEPGLRRVYSIDSLLYALTGLVAEEGRSSRAAARAGQVRGAGQRERRAQLEAQRRALAGACRRQGWKLVQALEGAGLSAPDLERPGIEEALRVLEGHDPQALVAQKRVRLAPALLELASLLESAHKQGWALLALDCTLEQGTPAGEQEATLLATFAQCERRLISERTRAALARKRAQGVRLGRPPSMSAYARERIRRERAAGKSLAAIAEGLNADRIPTAQGGRRWYPATIRYMLTRAR
jgi:DNA invertase Pin-like site-specific DNA recombinase